MIRFSPAPLIFEQQVLALMDRPLQDNYDRWCACRVLHCIRDPLGFRPRKKAVRLNRTEPASFQELFERGCGFDALWWLAAALAEQDYGARQRFAAFLHSMSSIDAFADLDILYLPRCPPITPSSGPYTRVFAVAGLVMFMTTETRVRFEITPNAAPFSLEPVRQAVEQ